jgi:hypothetical protein
MRSTAQIADNALVLKGHRFSDAESSAHQSRLQALRLYFEFVITRGGAEHRCASGLLAISGFSAIYVATTTRIQKHV